MLNNNIGTENVLWITMRPTSSLTVDWDEVESNDLFTEKVLAPQLYMYSTTRMFEPVHLSASPDKKYIKAALVCANVQNIKVTITSKYYLQPYVK